jgi:hypothetical protein
LPFAIVCSHAADRSIGRSENRTFQMTHSFLLLIVAIVGLLLPVVAQHKADMGQRTEKACLAEWRAKGASRPKGMTQDAFVAQCRGGQATQTAASSAEPSTNGAASPLQKTARPSAHLAQRRVSARHSRRHARLRIEDHASTAARADSNAGF